MKLVPLRTPSATAGLALGALLSAGSTACAEVYTPRPSGAVVITGNGGNGYHVWKNGEDLGGEGAVREAVAGDPRAEAQADQASSERAGSMITSLLGSVAWGVGWGLFSVDASQNSNRFPTALGDASIGILVGGAALWIVSGVLGGNAHTHMFNAVNIYNDDLAARGGVSPVIALPPPQVQGALPVTGPAVTVVPGPGYAPQPVQPVQPFAPAPLPAAMPQLQQQQPQPEQQPKAP